MLIRRAGRGEVNLGSFLGRVLQLALGRAFSGSSERPEKEDREERGAGLT